MYKQDIRGSDDQKDYGMAPIVLKHTGKEKNLK